MTKKEVLEWAYEIACQNLFTYSQNFAMTVPKAGYERMHEENRERVEIISEMMKEEE